MPHITDNTFYNSAPENDLFDVGVINRADVKSTVLDEPDVPDEVVEAEDKEDNIDSKEDNGVVNGQLVKGVRKIFRRNDPCPCGSGKKYKKCCGKS